MAIRMTVSYSGYVAQNLASSFGLRCTAAAGTGAAPGAGCRVLQESPASLAVGLLSVLASFML